MIPSNPNLQLAGKYEHDKKVYRVSFAISSTEVNRLNRPDGAGIIANKRFYLNIPNVELLGPEGYCYTIDSVITIAEDANQPTQYGNVMFASIMGLGNEQDYGVETDGRTSQYDRSTFHLHPQGSHSTPITQLYTVTDPKHMGRPLIHDRLQFAFDVSVVDYHFLALYQPPPPAPGQPLPEREFVIPDLAVNMMFYPNPEKVWS